MNKICSRCGNEDLPSDETYDIWLKLVETGEVVKTTDSIRWVCEEQCRREVLEFMWEDGNYACDCNRFLFANNFDEDMNFECSDGKVLARITWRGQEVYSDFYE